MPVVQWAKHMVKTPPVWLTHRDFALLPSLPQACKPQYRRGQEEIQKWLWTLCQMAAF